MYVRSSKQQKAPVRTWAARRHARASGVADHPSRRKLTLIFHPWKSFSQTADTDTNRNADSRYALPQTGSAGLRRAGRAAAQGLTRPGRYLCSPALFAEHAELLVKGKWRVRVYNSCQRVHRSTWDDRPCRLSHRLLDHRPELPFCFPDPHFREIVGMKIKQFLYPSGWPEQCGRVPFWAGQPSVLSPVPPLAELPLLGVNRHGYSMTMSC